MDMKERKIVVSNKLLSVSLGRHSTVKLEKIRVDALLTKFVIKLKASEVYHHMAYYLSHLNNMN